MTKLCKCCRGNGKVVGGGFLMTNCDECNGRGKIDTTTHKNNDARSKDLDVSTNAKIDKRSKAYKNAIKELTDSGLSKEEAEKVFSEEMERIDRDGKN